MYFLKEIFNFAKKNDALHWAAIEGNAKRVASLSARGMDVNAQDKNGKTPLHLAAFYGNYEVAIALIKHGAKVNARDNNENTPLYFAVWWGNKEIENLLIANGADINAKNKRGIPAAYLAKNRDQRVGARPFARPTEYL